MNWVEGQRRSVWGSEGGVGVESSSGANTEVERFDVRNETLDKQHSVISHTHTDSEVHNT